MQTYYIPCTNRVRNAIKDNVEIVDVDGSYLYRKIKRLETTGMNIAPPNHPTSLPISGWETISETNAAHLSQKMPCITNGLVYTYL